MARFLRWTLLAAIVTLVAVCFVSRWRWANLAWGPTGNDRFVGVAYGKFIVAEYTGMGIEHRAERWRSGTAKAPRLDLWFDWKSDGNGWRLAVPLWAMCLPLAAGMWPTLPANWRRRARGWARSAYAMRGRGRWTLTLATIAIIVLCPVSKRHWANGIFRPSDKNYFFGVAYGRVILGGDSGPKWRAETWLVGTSDQPRLNWWYEWEHTPGTRWRLAIPIWFVWLPLAGATAWAWWPVLRDSRRRRQGLCVRCGYDRRGLGEGAACPECGPATAPAGSAG